ncbi:MAG: KTSC domain-containing protein [Candidatus Absconditicoccaceae bacterium]
MDRIKVKSSNLISVGYDEENEILEIEFDSGIYQYYKVPLKVYEGLMDAISLGTYLNKYVKGVYKYKQIR